GTHEFNRARAVLTRRLIAERGFSAVAVEADWPDALRLNQYVRGGGSEVIRAFDTFQRFPRWMWRNSEVLELVEWMREHNAAAGPKGRQVGFYGLDLYSLHASMREVVRYLETRDPAAAERARQRYACFDRYGTDPQAYGHATSYGFADPCEGEVIEQLLELRRRQVVDGAREEDALFYAEQNARLASDAEAYYRAMYAGRDESWNLRDTHMADTADALSEYLGRRQGQPARLVLWAHNSHLGDARATQMGDQGELNLGQLLRERHGQETFNVGFTTWSGTVIAAREWDMPGLRRRVRPALPGSYEALFHEVGLPGFLLRMEDLGEAGAGLRERRLERAIGVIYAPHSERHSHYFYADLPAQFDAVLHYDTTSALRPLDRDAGHEEEDAADTWPFGM
ncbi:MAG: erythromycin esterase family protein, partial [Archangium sp.]